MSRIIWPNESGGVGNPDLLWLAEFEAQADAVVETEEAEATLTEHTWRFDVGASA